MMFEKGTLERKVGVGVSVLLAFLIIGATFFHNIEKWSWINSFYFSVVTLSTIGYGDLVPQHNITKIFLMFYIVVGVSVVLYVFTTIGSYYLEKHDEFMKKTIIEAKTNTKRIRHAGEHLDRHMDEKREELKSGLLGEYKKVKKKYKKITE